MFGLREANSSKCFQATQPIVYGHDRSTSTLQTDGQRTLHYVHGEGSTVQEKENLRRLLLTRASTPAKNHKQQR